MGYCPVPASTSTILRYAALLTRTHKFASLKQYINIVRILHKEADLPNPLEDNFHLDAVLKGIRRALGESVSRKMPITPQMLITLLSSLDLQQVAHCNIWAAALLMFFAMLRRSNVLPLSPSQFDPRRMLRRSDVIFNQQGTLIHIRWSKTIQFSQRVLYLPLPRLPGQVLCPTQALFKAFSLTPNAPTDGPAFVSSRDTKPLSAPTFLSAVRKELSGCDIPRSDISCHSFRRGGASWAFQAGIPVDTIRQIGDWKSNAYIKYIFESPQSLSQAMYTFISKTI